MLQHMYSLSIRVHSTLVRHIGAGAFLSLQSLQVYKAIKECQVEEPIIIIPNMVK